MAGKKCSTIGMFDSGVGGLTVYMELKKRFPKVNVDAKFLGDFGHPHGHASKSAHGVENTVLVFEESKDGKQRWTVEWGHAEVLCLERHGQQQSVVVEQTPKVVGHAAGWAEDRRGAHGAL